MAAAANLLASVAWPCTAQSKAPDAKLSASMIPATSPPPPPPPPPPAAAAAAAASDDDADAADIEQNGAREENTGKHASDCTLPSHT